MITKKFYQKYLPVLFYFPPELVLRQYKTMSIFLIFGVFQMLFIYKVLYVIKAGFHRSRLNSRTGVVSHAVYNKDSSYVPK